MLKPLPLLAAWMTLIALCAPLPIKTMASTFELNPDWLDNNMLGPVKSYSLWVDFPVRVDDGAYAVMKCGDQEIARASLSVNNLKHNYASISAEFDEELLLPKGNVYFLVVPERSILKLDDNSCYNKRFEMKFDVPATLGKGKPSIAEGSTVTSAALISFAFGHETEIALGTGPQALMFRDGTFVRHFPVGASWDWNIGTAYVNLFEGSSFRSMNFENGVKYTVVLPEGAVPALGRNDIVNEETRVSFIGGYKEPMPKLECTWISAFEEGLGENIGEVRFRFNMPVALSGDPKVQICLARPGYPAVTETTPFLRDEDGRQTLVADFGGYPQSSIGEAFTFVIKEGSVVSANGDVVVNDRTESPSFSGIDAVTADSSDAVTVKAVAGTVIVEGARDGATVRLYSTDGRMLCEAEASGGFATIAARNGIYIVSIDGIARKIAVK